MTPITVHVVGIAQEVLFDATPGGRETSSLLIRLPNGEILRCLVCEEDLKRVLGMVGSTLASPEAPPSPPRMEDDAFSTAFDDASDMSPVTFGGDVLEPDPSPMPVAPPSPTRGMARKVASDVAGNPIVPGVALIDLCGDAGDLE